MKIGDKVRFLSEVGGGIVRGFQGKDVALVEGDDGFEIPMLVKECVVVQTDEYNIPIRSVGKPKTKAAPEEPEDGAGAEAPPSQPEYSSIFFLLILLFSTKPILVSFSSSAV